MFKTNIENSSFHCKTKALILFILIVIFLNQLFAQNTDVLIGEGVAEISDNNARPAIVLAKKRAMADLAGQIKARVHSEFIHSIQEKQKEIDEYTRSKINVITDMEIDGVRFKIKQTHPFVQARAILSKSKTRQIYFQKCQTNVKEIRQRIRNSEQFIKANQSQIALPELLKASRMMNEWEQNKLIYFAIGGNDTLSLPNITHAEIDQKIARLLNKKIQTFEDALNVICFQLAQQIPTDASFKIYPFQYEDQNFGSSFSEYLRQELQTILPKYLTGKRQGVRSEKTDLLIDGTYWAHPKTMVILAQIQNTKGIITGNARIEIPKNLVDALGISCQPQNFVQAKKDATLLDDSQVAYGDLKMNVWTNHGTRDLLFKQGEHLRIFVRVNQPAYIRCIYYLANGMHTPLVDNFYINPTQVNKPIEISKDFDIICAPPFGVERMQVFASTTKFSKLRTKKITISTQSYEVLAESAQRLVYATRGFIRKKKAQKVKSAERIITVTTIPATIQ